MPRGPKGEKRHADVIGAANGGLVQTRYCTRKISESQQPDRTSPGSPANWGHFFGPGAARSFTRPPYGAMSSAMDQY
jgi:hypothetical protein